jgi:hypothetical protein
MKAAHSPVELAKGVAVVVGIAVFFLVVIHQITMSLG